MATNQGFKSLIPGPAISNRYLYWCMRHLTPVVQDMGRGATFKEVSKAAIDELEIPLPPLKEQRRIAALLDKADAIRRKRRESLQLLDDFLRSLFIDMFGDPATNPKGWPCLPLGLAFASDRGGTKCGPFGSALKRNEYVSEGIPVWTMDSIHGDRFCEDGSLFVTTTKYAELKAYSVKDGDIIISRAGTVGKMCVVRTSIPDSLISTNLIRLSLDEAKVVPEVFVALMTYCRGRVGSLRTGADGAYSFMNTSVLRNLPVPCPPIALQRKFSRALRHTRLMQGRYEDATTETSDLFGALSQNAFSSASVVASHGEAAQKGNASQRTSEVATGNLAIPVEPRYALDLDVYAYRIVQQLLRESHGTAKVRTVARAYAILSDQALLETLATDIDQTLEVKEWLAGQRQAVDLNQFMPTLGTLIDREFVQWKSPGLNGSLVLTQDAEPEEKDAWIVADARLALMLANQVPNEQEYSPSLVEIERLIAVAA